MSPNTEIYILIAVSLIILLLVYNAKHPATVYDFLLSEQKISPGLVSNLLLSTSFSLNGMLYQIWLGYQIGA